MRGQEDSIVMVVDDDPDIRESLTLTLEVRGYSVATAADGREALALLRGGDTLPCLILLDLMMPGMNGFELREALTADPVLRTIPVVAISGAGANMVSRWIAMEHELLRKPFELGVLMDIVKRFCAPLTSAPA